MDLKLLNQKQTGRASGPVHRVQTFSDFSEARRLLEPWLLQREAEHGLAIGILRSLESGEHDYESPFVAAVLSENRIVGFAFRTPPHKLAISDIPTEAIPGLVAEVRRAYDWIPAVLGPETAGTYFAAAWAASIGCTARSGARQRIYAARVAVLPEAPPEGQLRVASTEDTELAVEWTASFVSETGLLPANYDDHVRRLIAAEELYMWDDGQRRCMIGATAPTPSGIRIGYVYTPPANRDKGFASAATAHLTQLMLTRFDFCTLYTDLSNPTSNSIYQRIGYRPVADVSDINFLPQG
ncbi:MAG: ribosomal protein S18 acetylase RimI-like enzyme [Rhodothermales bacterium]|jgi:ribosomal protein S18 acetylase RimI-like enzyme